MVLIVGFYLCVGPANNVLNYSLVVYDPATLSPDCSPEDELKRYNFVEGTLYRDVPLRCSARGSPAPTITWYWVQRRLRPVRLANYTNSRVQYFLGEEATAIGSGTH